MQEFKDICLHIFLLNYLQMCYQDMVSHKDYLLNQQRFLAKVDIILHIFLWKCLRKFLQDIQNHKDYLSHWQKLWENCLDIDIYNKLYQIHNILLYIFQYIVVFFNLQILIGSIVHMYLYYFKRKEEVNNKICIHDYCLDPQTCLKDNI
jgi:hypothetical protein